MRRLIGRIGRDVFIESVVVLTDRRPQHRYRLVGGPDDGREFETLSALGDYVIALDANSHSLPPNSTIRGRTAELILGRSE